jgi:methionine biosynthesis protein MetW
MQMREYATKYDGLAGEDFLHQIPLRKEYILKKVGWGRKVLDVGCMGGKLSQLIMAQNNEVWGVEINPVAAALAQSRGISVKVADVEEGLPFFKDDEFDVVQAGEILEHLYDTKFFFQEAFRVLNSQGLLLLTIPNLNSLENRLRVVAGGYLNICGAYPEDHFGSHVRVFNLAKIRELLSQTGFKLVDARGVMNLNSYGRWLDRSLGKAGRILPSFSKMLMVTARKG